MDYRQDKIRRNRKRRRLMRRRRRIFLTVNVILCIAVVSILYANKNKSGDKAEKGGGYNDNIKQDNAKILSSSGEKKTDLSSKENEKNTVTANKISEFKRANVLAEKKEEYESFTVCLDPGHGGDDIGAEREDGNYEKDQVLKLSYLVKSYLESAGVKVVMTRTKDTAVSLEQRRNIAEECNADLLLSIHRNVYEGREEVNGIEAWINNSRPQDAKETAENILEGIKGRVSGINNRGVKWGTMDNVYENYGVNKVSMTSMILEVGFMTSDYDNKLFLKNLDEIAQGIAKGILDSI